MTEETIFAAALEKADPAERAAYLDAACAGDPALRQRVEALLGSHEDKHFLAAPIVQRASFPEDETRTSPGADARTAAWAGPGAEVGTVLAERYKLLEPIGEGGMGSVWMAEQTEPVRRRVAIKLIKPGMDSRQVLARFEAERQALALMDHPNIAKVLDGGAAADGRPFFVMELVKGVPLTTYCDTKRLGVRERLTLFAEVCRAVQHAHQKGIIHRDLKPSNVLVAPYDGKPVVKVIDFGIAKAAGQQLTEKTLFTGFGAVVGTPEYMSPEQAEVNNQDVDTRSDVYSLGVLLYELLTGTTPLTRQRVKEAALLEVLRLVREEEPPRPSTRLSTADGLASVAAVRGEDPARLTRLVRGELDWIVMKALEKDRARRYETANGLAAEVDRYLNGEPVLAVPPSATYRLRKTLRRNRVLVATTTLVLIVLIAGIIATTWQAMRARHEERNAVAAATAEREAKQLAENRLEQNKKAVNILTSVFHDLNPSTEAKDAKPLRTQLADRLIEAGAQLDELAVADPMTAARLQIELGQTLIWLDRKQDAHSLYQKAFATRLAHLGPDHPDTLRSQLYYGQFFATNGEPARSLEIFLHVLERRRAVLGPDHEQTLSVMASVGVAYSAVGKHADGVRILEEAVELLRTKYGWDHPVTAQTSGTLASLYLKVGEPAKAVALAERALERVRRDLGPDNPKTINAMGILAGAYAKTGQEARAQALRDEILARRRSALGLQNAATFNSISIIWKQAKASKEKGHFPEAEKDYRKALLLYEASVSDNARELPAERLDDLRRLRGEWMDLLKLTNRQSEAEAVARSAITYWERLAGDNPDVPALRLALARSLTQAGKHPAALGVYDKALERWPTDFPLVIGRAGCYRAMGLHAKALADASHGLELARDAPLTATWFIDLAKDLKADKQTAAAIESLSIAVKRWPNTWQAWHLRGVIHSEEKRWDKSVADLSRALALNPRQYHIWKWRSVANANLGQWDQALADAQKAVEINPNNHWVRYNSAWFLSNCPDTKRRDPMKAIEHARKGVELAPTEPALLRALGVAHYRAGDWKAALEALQKALALRQGGDIIEWLFSAMAYHQLRQTDKARTFYAKAVEVMDRIGPADEELHRFRAEAAELLGIPLPPVRKQDPPPPAPPGQKK